MHETCGSDASRLVDTDETELLPVRLGRVPARGGQSDLEKITAQGIVGGLALARAEGARLDQPDQVAGRIEPAELVEYVVTEPAKLEMQPQFLETPDAQNSA